MTTTKLKTSAFLVDLFPPSSDCTHSNYCSLVKNKINNVLVSNPDSSLYEVQVYLLTPASDENVSCDPNRIVPGNNSGDDDDPRAETFVVRNDDKIASFYEAKQRLDDQEIRNIQLLCSHTCQTFWRQVCQLLFTPVHDWNVKTVQCCCCSVGEGKGKNCYSLGDTNERCENVNCGCLAKEDQCDCRGLDDYESQGTHVNAGEKNGIYTPQSDFQANSSPQSNRQDLRCPVEPTLDETRQQIQRYLQTLPSLLGLPEADSSEVLRGVGAGFRHGFSTRRGGITSVSTLCSMNLVYTDKKPDSAMVVEENRRRLATLGGFDHINFHITKVEHGHKVWVVGEEPQPLKFDALVTDRRGVTITAAGADCIMLLFVDPVVMAIGAAHAGWKGSAERVAACVVNRMKEEYGCRPEDIRVALGPGVKLGCFSVPKKDAKLFSDIHPDCVTDFVKPGMKSRHRIDANCFQGFQQKYDCSAGQAHQQNFEIELCTLTGGKDSTSELICDLASEVVTDGVALSDSSKAGTDKVRPRHALQTDGDFKVQLVPKEQLKSKEARLPKDPSLQWTFVDLQLVNYHVLLQAGVKAEHIDMRTSHCTACNPELYFSYERDRFPFGNQIGFVCMPSPSQ